MRAFKHPEVAAVFAAYPAHVRPAMLELRELVFDTAQNTDGVGDIEETLKWGEPAYLTAKSKRGSTVRIDWKPARPDRYALYFNCRTDLVESFRTLFPNDFEFEGNRALVFRVGAELPKDAVACCVRSSLTYHWRQRGRRADTVPVR